MGLVVGFGSVGCVGFLVGFGWVRGIGFGSVGCAGLVLVRLGAWVWLFKVCSVGCVELVLVRFDFFVDFGFL